MLIASSVTPHLPAANFGPEGWDGATDQATALKHKGSGHIPLTTDARSGLYRSGSLQPNPSTANCGWDDLPHRRERAWMRRLRQCGKRIRLSMEATALLTGVITPRLSIIYC
jgi:hypothetical protein